MSCEGFNREQVNDVITAAIVRFGWTVQAVTPTDHNQPAFAYTIGLTESYGFPELVATGMEHDASATFLNTVGEMLIDGYSLDEAALEIGGRHGTVHPQWLVSGHWFNGWEAYYGEPPGPGGFVQVFPPESAFCPCHRHAAPDLTRPGGALGGNRAARRAATRRRRR